MQCQARFDAAALFRSGARMPSVPVCPVGRRSSAGTTTPGCPVASWPLMTEPSSGLAETVVVSLTAMASA
ncbi:hypothetical protein D3272_25800 [Lichenibacterium ramalinae]|uniref:Uncharacterized protein n=1 Tax=Lichenibacterium ramalinae TaxID=2316527 RepID=A0A4V1RHW9_9HYPH|nr:hypothetical protein D3272_25800 [Lichenibacterium ramalinae]